MQSNNSDMRAFIPPEDVSEPVRHALDLLNQDIGRELGELNHREQDEFWAQLHGYTSAVAEQSSPAPLIASVQHVRESVRRFLEKLDAAVARHLHNLVERDQMEFWKIVRDISAQHMKGSARPAA